MSLVLRVLTSLLCAIAAASAQSPIGAIIGTITDKTGAVIQKAVVSVENERTGVVEKTGPNESGVYRITNLQAGEYTLTVTATGLAESARKDLKVRVGDEVRIDVVLSPGDRAEVIEVSDVETLLQTQATNLSTVVGEKNVQELPLNGRQLQNLALLAPGVAGGWNLSTAANRYGKARENLEGAFVVHGRRGRSNNFVLDGMPMNVRQYGVINFEPSVESVQEFEIKTSSPSAEFGRTMGSTVSIVTRSGSNRLHGSAYEFLRNDKLDANDTFNKRAGLNRGKLRQNQFGGTLGGPIYKQRHFFFVNIESLRIIEGVETRVTSVPTANEARGAIAYRDASGASQTLDLSNRITPLSQRLLGFYPQPNSGSVAGLNYNSALTIELNDYQYHVRTDHHLTDRDTLTFRTSWNLNDQNYIVNRFGGPFIPGFSLPNPERTTNGTLGWVRTVSPGVINEARIGVNRYGNDLANGDLTTAEELGLPNGSTANGIPSVVFSSSALERLGGQPWFNREQNELTVFASNNVSILRGSHNIKLGLEATRLHFNTRGASNQRGTISFDGSRNGLIPAISGNERASVLADLLLGLPSEASITTGQFGRGYRQWAYAGFVQDSWRVTQKLTLNYGARYDYSAPWTEVNGKLSNFIPALGLVTVERLYEPDRNNLAPRFGFAYDLGGRGRTVVRGGFAVVYETLMQANSVQVIENNPPFAAAALTRVPTPFSKTGAPSTTLLDLRSQAQPSRAISAVDTVGFRNPYTMQYSFSVQQAIGQQWVLELAYAATRGLRLPLTYNLNQVPLDSLTSQQKSGISQAISARQDTTPILSKLRPYPAFDSINLSTNSAASIYHGMHLKLERRFSAGLNLLAAYTWSKSIDTASDYSSSDSSERVLNSANLSAQRGVSSFDIPHRFTASLNYSLPGRSVWIRGWQANGMITSQSGQPFTPFTSAFDPYRAESFNRPNVIGDPNQNVPAGAAFNPAALRTPAVGTFGNAGRNIVRGDGFHSVDLSIFRNIQISESMRVQIRLESVNALNHVNYQGPVTNLASVPGVFVAAAPPRIVQIGAKFTF